MASKRTTRVTTPEPAEVEVTETVEETKPADTNVVNFLIPLTTVALLVAFVLVELALKHYGAGLLA